MMRRSPIRCSSEAPPQTDERVSALIGGRLSRRSEAEPERAFGTVPSAREAITVP